MNLVYIHTISKDACKKAYEEFKHEVTNALFDLNLVFDCCMNNLKESIRQKAIKAIYKNYTPSKEQLIIIESILQHYETITLTTARAKYRPSSKKV